MKKYLILLLTTFLLASCGYFIKPISEKESLDKIWSKMQDEVGDDARIKYAYIKADGASDDFEYSEVRVINIDKDILTRVHFKDFSKADYEEISIPPAKSNKPEDRGEVISKIDYSSILNYIESCKKMLPSGVTFKHICSLEYNFNKDNNYPYAITFCVNCNGGFNCIKNKNIKQNTESYTEAKTNARGNTITRTKTRKYYSVTFLIDRKGNIKMQ